MTTLYCSGCEAETLPRFNNTCAWCDTPLKPLPTTNYWIGADSVLTASTFTAAINDVIRIRKFEL